MRPITCQFGEFIGVGDGDLVGVGEGLVLGLPVGLTSGDGDPSGVASVVGEGDGEGLLLWARMKKIPAITTSKRKIKRGKRSLFMLESS